MMKLSPDGKTFLKNNEGFRDKAYKCDSKKWTIGYGTRMMTFDDGAVLPVDGTTQITKQMAEKFLDNDLKKFESAVNSSVKVPLTQNQYDALISFIYNVGIEGFKSSNLLKHLNNKDYKKAALGFDGWHLPKTIIGRRNREKGVFMKVGNFPTPKELKEYEKGEFPI